MEKFRCFADLHDCTFDPYLANVPVLLQDFESVSDHFGTLYIKEL